MQRKRQLAVITINNKERMLEVPDEDLLQQLNQYLCQFPDEILHIPAMRVALASARIDALDAAEIRQMYDESQANQIRSTLQHNLEFLKQKSSLLRPSILTDPLRSIDYIGSNIKELKVLSIGPRTEVELYALTAIGFDPANIRGLDLISYSDRIDLGDMHAMPYEDDSFDVIVIGWVLAYSLTPEKAAAEILRVARPGAVVAVGCEYNPVAEGEEDSLQQDGARRYNRASDILDLFGGRVGQVYFHHDVHESLRDRPGGVMAIFGLA